MGIFTFIQPCLIFLRNLISSNRELLLNEIKINASGYFEILKTNTKLTVLHQNRGEDLFIPP
jgi:hypothetical protein